MLPLGVEMTVNIAVHGGSKFIDLVLTMYQEPDGQSGLCGNFNGDPVDDTHGIDMFTAAEAEELGAPFLPEAACKSPAALANATAICAALCGGGRGDELAASFAMGCAYDVCRGGPEFALQNCLVSWQTHAALAPAAIAPAISAATTLLGAGCCKPWRTIVESTPNLTRSECAIQCLSNAECDAFAISGCSGSSDETCGGQCHLYLMSPQEKAYSGACYDDALNGNTFCYTVQ